MSWTHSTIGGYFDHYFYHNLLEKIKSIA
uniref:Uncharacterized protein n=1 Tax=Arundo donax TaxID=35708 RepID=A0A0A9C0I4_ARUDO